MPSIQKVAFFHNNDRRVIGIHADALIALNIFKHGWELVQNWHPSQSADWCA